MLKKNFLLIIGCFFTLSSHAGITDIKSANNQLGIQLISNYTDYKETFIDGTLADTEKGWIPGFGFSGSFMKDVFLGNDYFKAQFSRIDGGLDYLGSVSNPTVAYLGETAYGSYAQNNNATITDFNFRYGKGFEINDKLMITPYGELGHHEWKRDLGDTCVVGSVPCSSSEKYAHYNYGIGGLIQYSPLQNWVFGIDALIGRTFSSQISGQGNTYLVVTPGGFTSSFKGQDLGDKTIYRIGVSADYAFTSKIHGNIGVDYVDFKYGKSDVFSDAFGGDIYEPDSKTNYTNIKVGIGYAF